MHRPIAAAIRRLARRWTSPIAARATERGRLRQRRNRPECQRSAVSVGAVSDSSRGVSKNLDRGFRDVLVVVRSARLAKVLEYPKALFPGFDAPLRSDVSQVT